MTIEAASFLDGLNIAYPEGNTLRRDGDNHLRLLKAVLKATFPGLTAAVYLDKAREDVASAATCAIGAATSNNVRITGTTTITSFGTIAEGVWRYVTLGSALVLTHHATALILPVGANISGAAGDGFLAISLGGGNWKVLLYQKANGKAILAPTFAEISAKPTTLAGYGITDGALKAQTAEAIAGGIFGALSNRDYTLVLKAPHAGTITETTTKCVSGTATATFKIGAVALGGTANAVSSAEQSQAHASANAFAAGDDIIVTISANATCVDMSFMIKYSRTLD